MHATIHLLISSLAKVIRTGPIVCLFFPGLLTALLLSWLEREGIHTAIAEWKLCISRERKLGKAPRLGGQGENWISVHA